MFLHKRRHRIAFGRLPNEICHVDGEKIRAAQIVVDRVHIDMVSIHMPTAFPTQRFHRRLGGVVHALWLRADEAVFAVGFIPNGNHLNPLLGQLHACLQLRCRLMRKPVAHANGVFLKNHKGAPT